MSGQDESRGKRNAVSAVVISERANGYQLEGGKDEIECEEIIWRSGLRSDDRAYCRE